MKLIYWNVRGIANQETRLVLKEFCSTHRPDILFISEPWMAFDKFPSSFWNSLNLKCFALNDRSNALPNLWGFWSVKLFPSVVAVSNQFIAASVMVGSQVIFFAGIYDCTTHSLRKHLWLDLANLQENHPAPWCFIGDFNAIISSHEKRGGNLPSPTSCEEFKAWSDRFNLTHLLTRGAEYTWSNKRKTRALVEMRMDRSICNDLWLSLWNSVSCCTLPKSQSPYFANPEKKKKYYVFSIFF